MPRIILSVLSGLMGALVSSCAGTNPVNVVKDITARDPAAPYLGMSVPDVIACAGKPQARYNRGANGEALTYRYSGAGPRAGGETKTWTCAATLVFDEGRLASVSFAPKKDGACAFSLPNCRR